MAFRLIKLAQGTLGSAAAAHLRSRLAVPALGGLRACVATIGQNQLRFYASSDLPEHQVVKMPALSPTMTTGTLQSWHVKEGDEVMAGDALGEVETDKATMSFDSTEDGVIAKLLVEEGTNDIPIGQPVLVLVESADDVAAFKDYVPDESETPSPAASEPESKPEPEKAPEPAKKEAQQPPTSSPPSSSKPSPQLQKSGDRIFASPLARRLAEKAELALSSIPGTGPRGRITKADVEAYADSAAAQQQPAAPSPEAAPAAAAQPTAPGVATPYTDIQLSNMRKTIARRLQESKQQIPHYYLTIDVNMNKAMALRAQLNAEANGDFKLSLNDFVIKASAKALREVKEVNSAWMDTFIRENDNVDISVAVATEKGLITPIVFDADAKGLKEISEDVRNLSAKARENKLAPEEYQGGTFTISNLGMYGIKHFTAIINPPQSCILAVGGTQKVLVPDENSELGHAVANMMSVTMSCDHRVVDGAVGATWLQHFKKYLENPINMLL